jgi:simple sugar transport system substrate-binding protein
MFGCFRFNNNKGVMMKKRLLLVFSLLMFGLSSTALAKLPCEDYRFVFFPGGSEGGPFSMIVYNGAQAAAEVLGCKIEYVWSGWNTLKMIQQIKEAIARRPDGIQVYGFLGEEALSPLVKMANERDIIITNINSTLPNLEKEYKASGFGFVGDNVYASGVALAENAAKKAGLKAGDKAMVWGLLNLPGRGMRTKGCIDGLEKQGIKVDYIQISDAVNTDASQGVPIFASYVVSNPDVKLIITDHGAITATTPLYMKSARKKPGDIFIAGFDPTPASLDGINKGWIGVVADQQPFLHGYLSVMQMFLTKKYGFSGLIIETGGAFMDKSNANELSDLVKQSVR